MKVPGYCSCKTPDQVLEEGIYSCNACGERIPDPLLLRVLAELLATRRQLAALERKLTKPKPPAPEWLTAKEMAPRFGRSLDFVYKHADELGARRVGAGPRPRLLFPVSSPVFPLDGGAS